MAEVLLENLTKRYGSVVAVNRVNLLINDREFFTILGPSGAGKTTILRLIAGFEEPDEGAIYFDGENVNDLRPFERKIKMVFQDFALWPHMQVYNQDRYSNLNFGLRIRKWLTEEIEQRISEVAHKVGIKKELFPRRPGELSEGEKQRVAIGRAITTTPRVFLMDDPMTNLDPQSKLKVRKEIRQLHQDLETTTIYVTHNIPDAMAMSDRMAVMREGIFEQINTPKNIFQFPKNDFVRDFFESAKVAFEI
jgi:multiple sugar transport system ATP-binding protein